MENLIEDITRREVIAETQLMKELALIDGLDDTSIEQIRKRVYQTYSNNQWVNELEKS